MGFLKWQGTKTEHWQDPLTNWKVCGRDDELRAYTTRQRLVFIIFLFYSLLPYTSGTRSSIIFIWTATKTTANGLRKTRTIHRRIPDTTSIKAVRCILSWNWKNTFRHLRCSQPVWEIVPPRGKILEKQSPNSFWAMLVSHS